MNQIKCFQNLDRLNEMLLKGEKGDAAYFSAKLDISERSFYRLLNYLKNANGLNIRFNKARKTYYLE
ncbi:MAG: hypothetical protein ACOC2M_00865 [bacterium]